MKNNKATSKFVGSACIGLTVLAFCAFPASAAESAPEWRPTYDLIMMWVNFLILFGVLYKFLKTPLMDFFQGKKYELEKEIKKAEEQKELAEAKIKESMQMLEEGEGRLISIKERIVAQGETQKAQIIEDAREQSQYMIAEAKRKVDSQIVRAREKFRKELIDVAFDKALERIPSMVTEEDGHRFVQNYIDHAMPS